MNIPAPLILVEIAAEMQVAPRQIPEQIVTGFEVMPQERISDRIVEQFVENSVSQFGKEIVEVVFMSPPQRLQQRMVEHIVDVPAPQAVDEITDVAGGHHEACRRTDREGPGVE